MWDSRLWGTSNKPEFKKYLDSIEVKVTITEVQDMGHNWPFWRQNLADSAKLLF